MKELVKDLLAEMKIVKCHKTQVIKFSKDKGNFET